MKKISDAYAIVSLAFALFSILGTLEFFLLTAQGNINIIRQTYKHIPVSLFILPTIPIIFGIIGLKSSAKKVAKSGIIISIIEILCKLLFLFVLPIIGFMLGGVG